MPRRSGDPKLALLGVVYASLAFLALLGISRAEIPSGDLEAPSPPTLPLPPSPPPSSPSAPSTPESLPETDQAVGELFPSLGFGGGLAVGIAVGVGASLLGFLLAGGAKLVTRENVLDNEVRRAIFDYIHSHPGTHLRAIAAALSLSTTNVLWHLRKLEESNLVASRKFEGYKVFYPVAGGVEMKRRALALSVLRNTHARQILEYVAANPGAHQRELARVLQVNHGTVRWHLRKLTQAGLLVKVEREYVVQYYLSNFGMEFLTPGSPIAPLPPLPLAGSTPRPLPPSRTVNPPAVPATGRVGQEPS